VDHILTCDNRVRIPYQTTPEELDLRACARTGAAVSTLLRPHSDSVYSVGVIWATSAHSRKRAPRAYGHMPRRRMTKWGPVSVFDAQSYQARGYRPRSHPVIRGQRRQAPMPQCRSDTVSLDSTWFSDRQTMEPLPEAPTRSHRPTRFLAARGHVITCPRQHMAPTAGNRSRLPVPFDHAPSAFTVRRVPPETVGVPSPTRA